MKMKTADRLLYAAIAAGTALVCIFNEVMAGVVVLVSAIGIIAIMRDKLVRGIYHEEAVEESDRMAEERFEEMVENTEYHVVYDRYVVLGKGYQK